MRTNEVSSVPHPSVGLLPKPWPWILGRNRKALKPALAASRQLSLTGQCVSTATPATLVKAIVWNAMALRLARATSPRPFTCRFVYHTHTHTHTNTDSLALVAITGNFTGSDCITQVIMTIRVLQVALAALVRHDMLDIDTRVDFHHSLQGAATVHTGSSQVQSRDKDKVLMYLQGWQTNQGTPLHALRPPNSELQSLSKFTGTLLRQRLGFWGRCECWELEIKAPTFPPVKRSAKMFPKSLQASWRFVLDTTDWYQSPAWKQHVHDRSWKFTKLWMWNPQSLDRRQQFGPLSSTPLHW